MRFRSENFQFTDLLVLYKEKLRIKNLPQYNLETVSQAELGRGKLKGEKESVVKLQKQGRLKEYNLNDCQLCMEIDKKLGMIELIEKVSEYSGTFIEDGNYNSVIVDTLLLREAYKKKIICKSKHEMSKLERREGRYKGAIVLTPKPGLHKNVLWIDFTSLYNRAIQTFNISPDVYLGKGIKDKDNIITPFGTKFDGNTIGLIPTVIKRFEDLRDFYKNKRNEFIGKPE